MHMKPKPWGEFKADLLCRYYPPKRSPETFRGICRALDQLEALGPIESTANLTRELIDELIRSRPAGQSPATLATLLSHVRAICNHAEKARWLVISPFSHGVHAKRLTGLTRPDPSAELRHLSREEIRRVLLLADEEARNLQGRHQWKARRLHALTATVAFCGLRASEALDLRVADVDLDARRIDLGDARGPQDVRLRWIPVPRALAGTLAGWLEHRLAPPAEVGTPSAVPWLFPNVTRTGPWRSGAPGTKPIECVKALGRRAGVDGVTLQSLRRSLATHLEHHGVIPQWVAVILGTGHAQPGGDATVRIFTVYNRDRLAAEVETFDFTERSQQRATAAVSDPGGRGRREGRL